MEVLDRVDAGRIGALQARGEVFWLDLRDPSGEDLDALETLLHLASGAVQDSREFGQRAKLDLYGDQALLVFYGTDGDEPDAGLVEVHVHITGTAVVTVRRRGCPRLEAARDRLEAATPETSAVAVVEAARLVLRHYLAEGEVARTRYRLTSSVPALRHREIASMQQYQRLFRGYIAGWRQGPAGARDADLRAELQANLVVTAHNVVLRRWLRGLTDDAEAEFDVAMAEVTAMLGHGPGAGPEGPAVVVFRTERDLATILPALRLMLGEPEG
jgi:CorA-like Mg2+ transporter protein